MLPAALMLALTMTPMNPGFHQTLLCNHGRVTIDVADAHPAAVPHGVLVTTTVSVGTRPARTQAIREADAAGNIYARGYVVDSGFKGFPKQLLLPAVPPQPGQVSSYSSISGDTIEKRYEGRSGAGYVFSDYYGGRKLNSVTYVPSIGVTEARFNALLPDGSDLVCRPSA
jgi:hypothetical protein